MVFKSDNNPTVSNSDENNAIILAAAGAVSPVNELNEANRAALCKTATVVHVQRNDQVKPENSHRWICLLYTSPSPRDKRQSRMPSSA